MSDDYFLVDAEALLIAWLLDVADLTAIVGDNIYVDIPGQIDDETPNEDLFPLVRVNLIGGKQTGNPALWVDHPSLQIDVFGRIGDGARVEARRCVDIIRREMAFTFIGAHEQGVVAHVIFHGTRSTPDTTFKPPRPHFHFDIDITTHPVVD